MAIDWIEVRGVTRLFGATAALRRASVRFDAGTITFLEGPNGAGKTTLLSIVATVLSATRGTVWYEPVGSDVSRVRRYIGWVGHDTHCYRELTARQNVELAAQLYGCDPRAAWQRVAARVRAEPFADRPVGQLSRGQRQRVALARALVHEPSVVLLDEPSSGLDAGSVDRLEQVLREERERGHVVVVVSHTPGFADRVGARRIRVAEGRVLADPPANAR